MWWPIFFLLLLGACRFVFLSSFLSLFSSSPFFFFFFFFFFSCGGEKVPSTIAILGGSRPAGVGCYDDSSGAALWECAWPAQLKGGERKKKIT